jgi:rubrerythrin
LEEETLMIFNFNAAEVFKMAIDIEENGRKFYLRARESVEDSEVNSLFEELAQQEVEHKKRFEALKAQLPEAVASNTVWDPDNEMDQYLRVMADEHVFVRSEDTEKELSRIKDVKDALKLAIEFEKDSVIFFLGIQDAVDAEKGKELIGILIKEEQEHLKRLSLELRRLSSH